MVTGKKRGGGDGVSVLPAAGIIVGGGGRGSGGGGSGNDRGSASGGGSDRGRGDGNGNGCCGGRTTRSD